MSSTSAGSSAGVGSRTERTAALVKNPWVARCTERACASSRMRTGSLAALFSSSVTSPRAGASDAICSTSLAVAVKYSQWADAQGYARAGEDRVGICPFGRGFVDHPPQEHDAADVRFLAAEHVEDLLPAGRRRQRDLLEEVASR